MQDAPTFGVMNSSPSLPPKKRRSPLRVVGLGLIAAVVLITVIGFMFSSSLLRPTAQNIDRGSKTGASSPQKANSGAPSSQPIAISHGMLTCSFSGGPEVMLTNLPWKPYLAWSSQGEVAVTNYASVRAYSAKNCASTTFAQSSIQRTAGALWSPDGKKLLVGDGGDNTLYVLNNQGKIVARLNNTGVASTVTASVWSSDSTKIIFAAQGPRQQLNLIQSMVSAMGTG